MLNVVIFDDVLFERNEQFDLPGLSVRVCAHADQAVDNVMKPGSPVDVVCMDYSMGAEHVTGEIAIADLRRAGFSGEIVAISSDPEANKRMQAAGAGEALAKKALLRPYLAHLGERGRSGQ